MKKFVLCLSTLALAFFLMQGQGLADTGMYKIQEYRVKLTPKSDGSVEIEYFQQWLVTGGHIPWITIGVPNSSFDIVSGSARGAVASIGDGSQGSWSGVRIDLDKDYQPNETFWVSFVINQHKLFWADENNYHLDFTPGWYDNAETEKLLLEVSFFADISTVTAEPAPATTEGQSMIWTTSLSQGQRFSISVAFPRQSFPDIAEGEVKPESSVDGTVLLIILLAVVGMVILVAVLSAAFGTGDGGGSYSGGTVYTGTYVGGGIHRGGSGRSSSVSRSTGGGGGFGGRSVSCACACVACACACACAGGGGAGCDRKIQHACPLCRQCKNYDCQLHPEHAKDG